MRTIRLKSASQTINPFYQADLRRIQRALLTHSWFADHSQCWQLWREYSDSLCAGWLVMSDISDEEIFEVLKPYFDAGDDVL